MKCVSFWASPRRLSANSRRFGTLYRFHLYRQVDEVCQVLGCVGYLYLTGFRRARSGANRKVSDWLGWVVLHPVVKGVVYTGCPRRNGQNFGRVFLMLKYTDITQNTYIQSWKIPEIMAREKCGLLAGLRTVPCQATFRMSVLDCHVRLQKYRWRCNSKLPLYW